MHHLVFRLVHSWRNPLLLLNHSNVKKVAPSAVIYDLDSQEQCFLVNYFKLLDDKPRYAVVQVEDHDVEQLQAMAVQSRNIITARDGGYHTAELIYVFQDIKRDALDRDAIMLKLGDGEEYKEDQAVSAATNRMNTFSRKFDKFMNDLRLAQSVLSKEVFDSVFQAHVQFKEGLDEHRKERKKAKADATKLIRSFKTKLLKFATYKNG